MPQISTNDVKLYYIETGSGTPIVFVHEFAGDYRSWENQMRYFSRRYRCIAYNARGYPPSHVPLDSAAYTPKLARDDLLGVLDGLMLRKAHIVGLAMGASAALRLALDCPERISSLVLAGCGGAGGAAEGRAEARALASLIEQSGIASVAGDCAIASERLPFKRKDPRGWQEFATQLAHHSSEGSALTLRGVQAEQPEWAGSEDDLQALTVPTLILAGDEDQASLAPSLYLKQAIPAAALAILPKSGHALNLEEPVLFNSLVQEFYSTVETLRWEVRQDPAVVA